MSDLEFERRVARALRAPVSTHPGARAAIMARVREAAALGAPTRALPFSIGRGTRQSIIGVALAAGIGSLTTLSALTPASPATSRGDAVSSTIIGDSVVDRVRDTLRFVRLIFADSVARQVAVIGDFNGWSTTATPMRRDGHSGRWTATLALRDGDHRYAILVDNVRRQAMPYDRRDGDGNAYSLLHVAPIAN